MLASLEGHVEVVHRLIQQGATVDLQSEVNYTTEVQNTQRRGSGVTLSLCTFLIGC